MAEVDAGNWPDALTTAPAAAEFDVGEEVTSASGQPLPMGVYKGP
jgi:hypothetical protein